MADIPVPSNVVYVNQPLIKMTRQGGHRCIGGLNLFSYHKIPKDYI